MKRAVTIRKTLEKEADHHSEINDRCDFGALFFELAVVVASVLILIQHRFL